MTYPPQQPGPPGPQQPPGPYGPYGGQQPPPDPYGPPQQSSYQGLGTYPTGPSEPPPPRKSHTGTIVAIVLVALLVLGGGGTAVYLVTKKKDEPTNSASNNQQTTQPSPTDDTSTPNETSTPTQLPSKGYGSPGEAQEAYVQAYQSKQFGPVVASACDAYKKKFGTDTTDLEKQLEPFDIRASADGEPEVDGSSATARINLELTKGSETKTPKIKIKIVKESGSWKFCGEGEA